MSAQVDVINYAAILVSKVLVVGAVKLALSRFSWRARSVLSEVDDPLSSVMALIRGVVAQLRPPSRSQEARPPRRGLAGVTVTALVIMAVLGLLQFAIALVIPGLLLGELRFDLAPSAPTSRSSLRPTSGATKWTGSAMNSVPRPLAGNASRQNKHVDDTLHPSRGTTGGTLTIYGYEPNLDHRQPVFVELNVVLLPGRRFRWKAWVRPDGKPLYSAQTSLRYPSDFALLRRMVFDKAAHATAASSPIPEVPIYVRTLDDEDFKSLTSSDGTLSISRNSGTSYGSYLGFSLLGPILAQLSLLLIVLNLVWNKHGPAEQIVREWCTARGDNRCAASLADILQDVRVSKSTEGGQGLTLDTIPFVHGRIC